ncbi:hypothetical protein BH23CHL5_BH23CHL5_17400 [soil metagenome]
MVIELDRRKVLAGSFLAILLSIVAVAAAFSSQNATPESAFPPPVVREALVSGLPENAPGQALQLVRYVIQPGTTLPAHTHPGMQIAWIESGVLHYVVVEGGEIPIARAGMEGSPEPVEMLGPGMETNLYPGDSVVEVENVVHYGANLGTEPVVILAATLLTDGAPPATVIEPAATPAS